MRDVSWNADHNYSIVLAVITDSERDVTSGTAPYKRNWIVVRRSDTLLKVLKPKKEHFFFFLTKINSSNRTFAIWDRLIYVERNCQSHLMRTQLLRTSLVPKKISEALNFNKFLKSTYSCFIIIKHFVFNKACVSP
jgi:hypothetical protein